MRLSRLIGMLALAMIAVAANAQLKIGHINSQELLAAMPETDSAQKKLANLAKESELMLEELNVEFNKKWEDYSKKLEDKENPMSPLIRSAKEAELQELQQRIQVFRQQAEQDLQKQRAELLQPIQETALKAVNEVAEENGFTYVLDMGIGVVIYAAPDSEDILPLVKKKLNLK